MRLGSVGVALLATACVEVNDPCGDLSQQSPTLEIGTGDSEYETMVPGGVLETHRGPQGGYHAYGSIRATALYPGPQEEIERYFGDSGTQSAGLQRLNPTASYQITDESGAVRAERALQEPLLPEEDETLTRWGDVVFFTQGTAPEEIEGAVVDFSMTITDLCGREISDTVTGMTLTVVQP